jgi:hypothetical protein
MVPNSAGYYEEKRGGEGVFLAVVTFGAFESSNSGADFRAAAARSGRNLSLGSEH